MLKPVFYSVCVLLCAFSSLNAQQNLVPNGGFEEYYNCPNYAQGFYIDACKYWTMPTQGSSDYFNACSTEFDAFLGYYLFSVPENYYGNQAAKEGNAYAGLGFSQENDTSLTYAEYIQVQLKQTLQAGAFYHLKFFVHNPLIECPNSIGALFTPNPLNINNDYVIPLTPQFQSDLTQFFCDTNTWYELNYTFQASGTENYLTIGVFTPLYVLKLTDYSGTIITKPNQAPAGVRLYIDDVSLVETDPFEYTNTFSPNSDGVNDLFTIESTFFDEVTIYNRWGTVVYHTDGKVAWDGKYNHLDCAEGVYYYSLKLKNNTTKNGFLALVR
jgi:gliding motility-associated-like protein